MLASTKFHPGPLIPSVVRLLVAGALLSALAYGQQGQSQGGKTPGASKNGKIAREIEEARRAKDNKGTANYDIEQLAEAGAVEAIPMLEEKFAQIPGGPSKYPSWDAANKAQVASALVRLGDKKQIYWDYLVKQATLAVESDAPDPTSYDSKGKPEVSKAFIAWVKAHGLGHAGVWDEYRYLLAGPVLLLGITGDPRAVPVLRRGLLSPNYLIEALSATGLAQIGDEASVPFIIEACKKAPRHEASTIALQLIYFNDPEAQKAVDEYVPKEDAKAHREQIARGKKKPLL
jgi:PBS lyase HEAT-like repeat